MKKTKFIAAFFSLALVGSAFAAISHNQVKEARAATCTITDSASFFSVFDSGGTHCNDDIELQADIDLSSITDTQAGSLMAGEYKGTFNGNGHLISGLGGSKWHTNMGGLFNIVGKDAVIKDLVVDWTAKVTNVGAIGYENAGRLENVTVFSHTKAGGPSDFGGFFNLSDDTAQYDDCNSHFINEEGGARGAAVGALYHSGSADTVSNCIYSDTRIGAGAADITAQNCTLVSMATTYQSIETIAVGDSFEADAMGVPATWATTDPHVSVSGRTITGVSATDTDARVNATIDSTYAAFYPTYGFYYDVEVVDTLPPVTDVSLSPTSYQCFEGDEQVITVTLTGSTFDDCTWVSDDDTIASVTGDANSAVILAEGVGSTTVTFTLNPGGGASPIVRTVDVAVFEAETAPLPINAETTYNWNGAGLKFNLDVASLPSTTPADYNINSTCSGAISILFDHGSFDGVFGATVPLYLAFKAAPQASSGVYTIHVELTYKGSFGVDATPKTTYTADIVFDGVTKVTPSLTISGVAELGIDSSSDYSLSATYFTPDTYKWVVTPTSGNASIDDDEAAVITLTGVSEGEIELSVTATDAGGKEMVANKTIQIVAVESDISAIYFDVDSLTLKEGFTGTINATFDGSLYNSFGWSSTNETVATVTNTSKESTTITALADGTTTIELAIVTDTTSPSESIVVTVEDATIVDVFFVVSDSFTSMGGTDFGVILYGPGSDYVVPLVDTNINMTYSSITQSIYHAELNMDLAGKMDGSSIKADVYLQFCRVSTLGRWGAGFAFTSLDGYTLTADWSNGSKSYTNLGSSLDMAMVLAFINGYMHTEIPFSNEGTTADCAANYNAAIAQVEGYLNSSNRATLFTYTDYYLRLQKWAIANGHTFEIDAGGEIHIGRVEYTPIFNEIANDPTTMILVISLVAVAAIGICGYVYLRRRKTY